MSPTEALECLVFTCTKKVETHLETAILDGDTHFVILFQFHCTLSVEAFKQFAPKVCILVQRYIFSFSVKNFCLCKMSIVCLKHAFMPSQIAVQYNEGSAPQCIFIITCTIIFYLCSLLIYAVAVFTTKIV